MFASTDIRLKKPKLGEKKPKLNIGSKGKVDLKDLERFMLNNIKHTSLRLNHQILEVDHIRIMCIMARYFLI